MTWDRLILLFLVASLALPATLLAAPTAAPLGAPGGLPVQAAITATDAPATHLPSAGKSTKRKKQERRERRERRQASRQRDRATAQEQGSPPMTGDPRRALCEDAGMIYLPGTKTCTHGPDQAPEGVTARTRPATLPAREARAAAFPCDSDGVTGPRVQVIYARGASTPSRYNDYLPSIRAWVADADQLMQDSAQAAGGGARRIRFVTTAGPGCELQVPEVVIPAAAARSFSGATEAVKAAGHDRTDRMYLVYTDDVWSPNCGQGNWWNDDSPAQANWNNYGPRYAGLDATCWTREDVAIHELLHTLGAVQPTAPNGTRGAHCIDEFDVMCYSDPPDFPAMRYDCPQPADDLRLDCHHDDYFNTSGSPGGYLASHWNVANSRFLVGGGAGPADDGRPPVVTWVSPTGNNEEISASAGTVQLTVTASDASGINRIVFRVYDNGQQQWRELATLRTSPYSMPIEITTLDMGVNFIHVDAYDGTIARTVEHIRIHRTDSPIPPPAAVAPVITSPANGARVKSKSRVTLSARSNSSTPAAFRYCLATSCTWERGIPTGTPWRAPKKGKATFLVRAGEGPVSDPVTVTIQKAKKKKKKR